MDVNKLRGCFSGKIRSVNMPNLRFTHDLLF